jgi:Tol biopolymer transport system component
MDADGGNLKQLTEGPGDFIARSSPDGRWVVFPSARSGSTRLWKVSIDGGEPMRLTDKFTEAPTVSPDGSLIACVYREDQPNAPNKVAIIPFAGGDPIKLLDIPQSFNRTAGLSWMPDWRTLTFMDTINGVSNIWSLPLDASAPKQLTNFKTEQIFWFDFSRDGKTARPLARHADERRDSDRRLQMTLASGTKLGIVTFTNLSMALAPA